MKNILWILISLMVAPVVSGMIDAQVVKTDKRDVEDILAEVDSQKNVDYGNYLDRLPGTHPVGSLSVDTTSGEGMWANIVATYRTYGDSVVLRWVVDQYPEWTYLNSTGYDVLRYDANEKFTHFDTLATRLRPMPLERFRECYPDTIDSLAYMAMGAVYGTGDMTFEETGYEPGSPGAFAELEQDQKTRLMAAYLAAEWRPDLAAALALRFVDRTAKRGHTYHYFVSPSREDTTGQFVIHNAVIEDVKNEKYKPKPYDITITDSVSGHGLVTLTWNDHTNGTFDIFFRKAGTKEWKKVNERPYVPPLKFDGNEEDVVFNHEHGNVGFYEYAVQAYDAFGDVTPLSAVKRVYFPDMMPPKGPEITLIEIERPGKNPWDTVYANIHFHKSEFEPDFVRYVPMYHSTRDSSMQWRLLSNQYIAPTDTLARIDVTNVSTGMITFAAVDTADNMGYSIPRQLRVGDMKPPKAPVNVKALPIITGEIALTWDMEEDYDVHYYDVFYANSLTHSFTQANARHLSAKSFTDTVDVKLNERYIYYTVQAVDWDDNRGEFSDTIAVLRPNVGIPTRAYLDSAWVDKQMIHTRWVGASDEIISHYNVYSRKAGANDWNLLRVFDGDSVRANGFYMQVDDAPGGSVNQRYEYAVETMSFWDISSGLTPVFSAKLKYDAVIDVPIKLLGTYRESDKAVRLAWEIDKSTQQAPYYVCLYRKSGDSSRFRYLTDIPSERSYYVDYGVTPGETVEYYVKLQFRDGRETLDSETLTVTVPKAQNDNK